MYREIVEAIRDWCKAKFQPLGNYAVQGDIPSKVSQLENDCNFITAEQMNAALSNCFASISEATADSIGGVKSDGHSIMIDADGKADREGGE